MFGTRHDHLTNLYKTSKSDDDIIKKLYGYYKINNFIMENFSFKTELKSFLITFFVAFLLVVYEQLNSLTMETLKNGAYLGLLFGATRAGVKAVIELFLMKFKK